MQHESEEIRIKGKTIIVPSVSIKDRKIVVTGNWTRIAAVKDEELYHGEAVDDPGYFVNELKRGKFEADIFSFAQRLTDPRPKHPFHMEWDNAAVIPIKDYADWWEKRLSQDARRNVRRAAKMGVTVRLARFDDEFVKGIVDIYDETPVRQGTRFVHYQKGFEVVKREAGTYPDRSEFIGAYFNNALIGFIKLICTDDCAHIIHILSKEQHADKRPTNALIAKAVEVSVNKGMAYLTYCRYIDGGNEQSPLTEFKRRNGFEQLLYPRYFVALTARGRLALGMRFHHGLRRMLPIGIVRILLNLRAKFYSIAHRKWGRGSRTAREA